MHEFKQRRNDLLARIYSARDLRYIYNSQFTALTLPPSLSHFAVGHTSSAFVVTPHTSFALFHSSLVLFRFLTEEQPLPTHLQTHLYIPVSQMSQRVFLTTSDCPVLAHPYDVSRFSLSFMHYLNVMLLSGYCTCTHTHAPARTRTRTYSVRLQKATKFPALVQLLDLLSIL